MTDPATGSDSLSLLFHLFAASQGARGLLNAALRDSPLNPDEYAVYSAAAEPGPHTPTSLRLRLGMPAPTLSDYLAAMTARGHLKRKANPQDGRSTLLSLTRSGRTAHTRTAKAFEPALRRFLAELDTDTRTLRANLVELREAALAALER